MKKDAFTEQVIVGDFAGSDDLLWGAQTGALQDIGPVRVTRSGRIGPLVEIIMARRSNPAAFAQVVLDAPFAAMIENSLSCDQVSGTVRDARAGTFPLRRLGSEGNLTDEWKLWASRADQAAIAAGFPPLLAAELIGALGELQDNVFRHSHAFESGIVAFAATRGSFEVVVSDAGIGVLASLRQHPDYARIQDTGEALKLAVADGESRLGRTSGAGFGMGQMFRALANHDGDLRFRSGDHALEVHGHSPSLQGSVEILHKAGLTGLTISVLCRAAGRPNHSP